MSSASPNSARPDSSRFSIPKQPRMFLGGLAVSVVLFVGFVIVIGRQTPIVGMTLKSRIANVYATDIDLSPQGTRVAVTGYEPPTANRRLLQVCVLEVASGQVAARLPVDAQNAAWLRDRSRLAVATGTQIEEYEHPGGIKPLATFEVGRGGAGCLTYDHFGDLFACTDIAGAERFAESQVFIWLRDGNKLRDAREEIRASPTGSVRCVSVATHGDRLRLAVVHDSPLGITVCSLTPPPSEERTIRTEFVFPGYFNCWVRLSPSGEHLAILSGAGFELFDLRNDPPSLLHREGNGPEGFFCQRQPIDISLDGSRIAYVLRERVVVRRMRDGGFISSAAGHFICVSISADGGELAAVDATTHSLCLFDVP